MCALASFRTKEEVRRVRRARELGGAGGVQISTSRVTPGRVQTPGFRRNKIWINPEGKGTQGRAGSKEHRGGDPPPSQPGLCVLPGTRAQLDLSARPKPSTASLHLLCHSPASSDSLENLLLCPDPDPGSPSSRCLGPMPEFLNP